MLQVKVLEIWLVRLTSFELAEVTISCCQTHSQFIKKHVICLKFLFYLKKGFEVHSLVLEHSLLEGNCVDFVLNRVAEERINELCVIFLSYLFADSNSGT